MVICMILIISSLEFLLGTALHFLYDLFPYPIISLFASTNESVFEHLKLLVYPMLVGYLVIYLIKKKEIRKYRQAMLWGIVSGLLSLLFIYYFVRYGLGIESLIFDIVLLWVALFIGNSISLHFYRYSKSSFPILETICLIMIVVIMIIGTLYPPQVPLFQEEKVTVRLFQ